MMRTQGISDSKDNWSIYAITLTYIHTVTSRIEPLWLYCFEDALEGGQFGTGASIIPTVSFFGER